MSKRQGSFSIRRFMYCVALGLVLAANINAIAEPVIAQTQYVWSRQQSVVEKVGRWDSAKFDSPVNSIHAALLNTGKVLLIAGSGNDEQQFNAKTFRTVIWDPATYKFTEVPTPWDAFCAGHVFLPDGKLLVAGGTKIYEDLDKVPRQEYGGLKDSYIFDPATERYEKVDNMDIARWYPTLVTLGNGSVVAVAGLNENGQKSSGETEIFDPATKQWTLSDTLNYVFPTYPALFLTGDGRLFYSGSHQGYEPGDQSLKPGFWDLKTNAFQEVAGLPGPEFTNNSSSILLPPAQDQRVMILGGGGAGDSPLATNRTAIIDLDSPNPVYAQGPNLKDVSRYPGVVILPDDTVFQTGGSTGYRTDNNFASQIFHPDTNTITQAAKPRVGRNYHSEAILLPDGRVATFGSNPLQDNAFEMRIEVYSPAYLFKGDRPLIKGGNKELVRGTSTTLKTSGNVKTAKLIRPSAVTHVTDADQRSINLPFTKTKDGIKVDVPENPNLVPPGWYMAFVTNQNDVPSQAYWVHVQ